MKILGVTRPSLYGDIICSLVFSTYLEKIHPNSCKIALIDNKCSSISPLLVNAPYIDGVRITDEPDKITQNDEKYFKKFNIVFNLFPQPTEKYWYNKMSVIEQTFKMNWLRGRDEISLKGWNILTEDEKKPRLTQYFPVENQNKCIAIWSSSGYGMDPVNEKRNPSVLYWNQLVLRLIKEGYKVAQLGTPDHESVCDGILDLRYLSLFEAVRFSLGCKACIQTDSGSAHIIGAFGRPQILLTTYWRKGHFQFPDALIPVNYKNRAINLFNPQNINSIEYDRIIEGIKSLDE